MWHTIVWCNFQVYYVFQRWHLPTLWDDHYDESSNHLSLCKVIVKLLSMFLMLYITSMWLIYYITGSLCLLIPFTYFMHLPPTFPLNYSYCSIYSLLLFWLVCLDFTCETIQYLSFSVSLISLLFRFIHAVTNARFHFLWPSNISLNIIYIYMNKEHICIYICTHHIFFIHSSINR